MSRQRVRHVYAVISIASLHMHRQQDKWQQRTCTHCTAWLHESRTFGGKRCTWQFCVLIGPLLPVLHYAGNLPRLHRAIAAVDERSSLRSRFHKVNQEDAQHIGAQAFLAAASMAKKSMFSSSCAILLALAYASSSEDAVMWCD